MNQKIQYWNLSIFKLCSFINHNYNGFINELKDRSQQNYIDHLKDTEIIGSSTSGKVVFTPFDVLTLFTKATIGDLI